MPRREQPGGEEQHRGDQHDRAARGQVQRPGQVDPEQRGQRPQPGGGQLTAFGQGELARGSARYAAEWTRNPERVAVAYERSCSSMWHLAWTGDIALDLDERWDDNTALSWGGAA